MLGKSDHLSHARRYIRSLSAPLCQQKQVHSLDYLFTLMAEQASADNASEHNNRLDIYQHKRRPFLLFGIARPYLSERMMLITVPLISSLPRLKQRNPLAQAN